MWLRISCDLTFDLSVSTPFILMLRPRSGAQQWVASEKYKISPSIPVFEFTDGYGNLCQRLVAPPGFFSVETSADVRISDYIDQAGGAGFVEVQYLPDSVLSYLLPSRYCESDRFSELANSITIGQNPGYDQVLTINQWLRNTISYVPGSSDYPLSAIEVNHKQYGVCRDLAHLGIALCRSLSIPARFVVGYLLDLKPMDMHAWYEVYIGGRWYTFDATQTVLKGGYIAVGFGRDAADVAIYNQFGPVAHLTTQSIKVEHISEDY